VAAATSLALRGLNGVPGSDSIGSSRKANKPSLATDAVNEITKQEHHYMYEHA